MVRVDCKCLSVFASTKGNQSEKCDTTVDQNKLARSVYAAVSNVDIEWLCNIYCLTMHME